MSEPTRHDARPPATYAGAGVSIEAGNALVRAIAPLAAATRRPGADAALGGFGGVFDLGAAGFADPLLVAATDGVGTKLMLGRAAGRLEGLGQDLVAMCVNDLVVQGAEPLFFLDYLATGRLDPAEAAVLVGGIARACREAGAALIGGETAEMPGLYQPGEFDLAGFAVGAVERGRLLPRTDVAPGDRLLGLASSGLHANGFSLVRALVDGMDLAGPAPFQPDVSLAEALLVPTRLYVRPLLPLVAEGRLKALAHITGGGLLENLPRVLPAGCHARLDAGAWARAELFDWLQQRGRIEPAEMARTFNNGAGMVLVVAPDQAEATARRLAAAGERVMALGMVEPGVRGCTMVGPAGSWGQGSAWTATHEA